MSQHHALAHKVHTGEESSHYRLPYLEPKYRGDKILERILERESMALLALAIGAGLLAWRLGR